MEFGNLIPGKFCFWREIFAIFKDNLSFGYFGHFRTKMSEICELFYIFDQIPWRFCIFKSSFSSAFSQQTNIPFLENVLRHQQFVAGKVDTNFIDDNPSLTKDFKSSQNRAQKLLHYFGNVMVNGPSTPLATGLAPAIGEAPVPETPWGE